jgi:hypothetical protein
MVACSLELDLAGVGAAGIACVERTNCCLIFTQANVSLLFCFLLGPFFNNDGRRDGVSRLDLFSQAARWVEDFFCA